MSSKSLSKSSKIGGSFKKLLKDTLQDISREEKTTKSIEWKWPGDPKTDVTESEQTANPFLEHTNDTTRDKSNQKVPTVQSTKKRKFSATNYIEPSAKRMKRMETLQEIILSRKGNLMGTLYVADIIGVNKDDGYFNVNAECKGFSHIPDGILPFTHLCDSAAMSLQLALSITNLIKCKGGSANQLFMEYRQIPVLLFDISEDGMPVFTAKNMLVSHRSDHTFPRQNAYQINNAYRSIQRQIPMIGTIRNVDVDTISVSHSLEVQSTADYNDYLPL